VTDDLYAHTRSTVAAATWGPPNTGVILGRLVLDATQLQLWAGQVEQQQGVAVEAHHAVASAVGRALVAAPGLNRVVRLGAPTQRNGVAVTIVDRGHHVRVDDADLMSISALADAARHHVDDDASWEQTGRALRFIPSAMLRVVLRLVGLMGRIGAGVPGLGVEPGAMGAAVVERGAGFDTQFNPPVPHIAAGVHVVVGAITDRVIAHAGVPAVRPTLAIDVTVDARLCANDELEVFVDVIRAALDDPWSLGAPEIDGVAGADTQLRNDPVKS
jgi:hypothetical protein